MSRVSLQAREGKQICPNCKADVAARTRLQKTETGRSRLKDRRPDLEQYWRGIADPARRELTFGTVCYISGYTARWACAKCGSEFERSVNKVSQNKGAPLCLACSRAQTAFRKLQRHVEEVGSLAELYPALAEEWVEDISHSSYRTNHVSPGCGDLVVWRCSKCGHIWRTSVANRVNRRSGCPACSGNVAVEGVNDLETWCRKNNRLYLLDEYDRKENFLPPNKVSYASSEKLAWICSSPIHGTKGYQFRSTPAHRTGQGEGCPICAVLDKCSFPQAALAFYLRREFGTEQVALEYCGADVAPFKIDAILTASKIAFEYDGGAWHKDPDRDLRKDQRCLEAGLRLIRIREPGCCEYDFKAVEVIHRRKGDVSDDLSRAIGKAIDVARSMVSSEAKGSGLPVDVMKDYSRIRAFRQELRRIRTKGGIENCSRDLVMVAENEHLRELYHPRNPVDPSCVHLYSNDVSIWWRHWHEESGEWHEWQRTPKKMTKGSTCPYCSGKRLKPGFNDFATRYPDYAEECSEENEIPSDQLLGAPGIICIWTCKKCGQRFETSPNSRVNKGTGCPFCAKDLSKTSVIRVEDGRRYVSVREAAEDNGIRYNTISAALDRSNRTAAGYHWKRDSHKTVKLPRRKVECVETQEVFDSIAEAARTMGIGRSSISRALKVGGRAGKLHWKYYEG